MGILNRMEAKWKAMSTSQKISKVLDVITTIGSGMIGGDIGRRLGSGKNIVARICISVTTAGLGIAAGEVSCKALTEAYAEPLGGAIDAYRSKQKSKEENEHGYTRY